MVYGAWQRRRAAVPRGVDEAFGQSDHELHADGDLALANFQARIGRNQLARLDALLARRRELAYMYRPGVEFAFPTFVLHLSSKTPVTHSILSGCPAVTRGASKRA